MKFFKILGLILMLAALAFVGMCAYSMLKGDKQEGPAPPAVNKAAYSLTMKSTGVTLYTQKVMVSGEGEKSYYLPDGYWEANKGDRFVFKKVPLTLDENIFGKIEVRKR